MLAGCLVCIELGLTDSKLGVVTIAQPRRCMVRKRRFGSFGIAASGLGVILRFVFVLYFVFSLESMVRKSPRVVLMVFFVCWCHSYLFIVYWCYLLALSFVFLFFGVILNYLSFIRVILVY